MTYHPMPYALDANHKVLTKLPNSERMLKIKIMNLVPP